MKNLYLMFAFWLVCSSSFALSLQKPKLETLIFLYESGEYEEAIDVGLKLYESKKNNDKAQTSIVSAYLSMAYYNWYDFGNAQLFANKSLEYLDKSKSESNNNIIASLVAVEACFVRNEWPKADSLLSTIIKPNNQTELSNYLKFNVLKAKSLKNIGKFNEAIAIIDENETYLFSQNDSLLPKKLLYRAEDLALKSQILLEFGLPKLALIANDSLTAIINRNKAAATKFRFNKSFNRALIYEHYKNYRKASSEFLVAFNANQWSENHVDKQEALRKATINAIKDENWTEFEKLFRRVDMGSFKRAGNRQIFGPNSAELRILEAMEKGQFKLANQKANLALKTFRFLPKSHLASINLFKCKQQTSEFEGELKDAKRFLDSLETGFILSKGLISVDYADIKLQQAIYEVKYGGDFKKAKNIFYTYFDKFLDVKLATNAVAKLDYLENYTLLFELTDKPDSALIKAQEGFDIATIALGKVAFETQFFQSLLASNQLNTGKYSEFLNSLNDAYNLKSTGTTADLSFYIKALYLQASLLNGLGEYDKMEDRLIRAYQISLLKEEKKFFDRYQIIEDQAAMNIINSNFFKAEKNLRKSINAKLEKVDEKAFILLTPTLLLADLKLQKGELKEADYLIGQYEAIANSYFDKNSSEIAQFMSLQSRYFLAISDYKKAQDFQLKVIEAFTKIFGENHLRLASEYAKLAEILLKDPKTNPYEANKLYEKALANVSNAIGQNTPLYANFLVKQAELLLQINGYDIAETNLNRAEKFWLDKLGKSNPHLAEISLIKGKLFYLKRNFRVANDNFENAAQLYATLFNKLQPGYLLANVGLAKVAYMNSDFAKAEATLKPVLEARLLFVNRNFSIMSFGQKSDYWAGFREEFELYNSILFKLQADKPNKENLQSMYNFALQTKGILLNSDAKLRRKVLTAGDSTLSYLYQEWLHQKEYFALVSTFSKQQLIDEGVNIAEIENYVNDLEKDINAKTGNLIASNKTHTWKDVQSALTEKSSAVEILRFRYFNHTFSDTVVYAFLSIVDKTIAGPDAIFSLDGKKMESSYLKYYRNASINKLENEYSYDNFLKPFLPVLPDGNTIYLSSEGVYNQINPEMLYNEATKKYALENNTFVYVSNTKDLVVEPEKKAKEKAVAPVYYLFGNPKFYEPKLIGRKDTVSNLAGAEAEIEGISSVLSKNGQKMVKLIGAEVSEDTVKSMQSPTVFHIATHGFFMEGSKDQNATKNPMLNSGLMLKSSGNILANLEGSYINQTSGMLTASEVMEMNFANTNLVVLSACETGRGQTEVGEGVYGLQRAFLVAGAKSIILSLFKVDDEATKLLMTRMYEKVLQNGGDYRTAFREAKQELRNSETFEKPIYWGSFIMIESKPTKSQVSNKIN